MQQRSMYILTTYKIFYLNILYVRENRKIINYKLYIFMYDKCCTYKIIAHR